jgi:hypothetical protein
LVDAGFAGRSRRGAGEHGREVSLVAGPGSNMAACCGMYDVKVVELRPVEGAMDSLAECDDCGSSSGEPEHMAEDIRIQLPAVVTVLKEVHEGDRGGIDPAGTKRGMQSAAGQAAVRPADAHSTRAPRAALADKDQVGHELVSGGGEGHGRSGPGAGAPRRASAGASVADGVGGEAAVRQNQCDVAD